MNQNLIRTIVREITSAPVLSIELVQELWSGYGEILRVKFHDQSIIVKLIRFPDETIHPRGWNSPVGHKRKVESYKVESFWYENFAPSLSSAKVANVLGIGKKEETQYIVLEDLCQQGFIRVNSPTQKQIVDCLSWLANFHKHYLNAQVKGLWPIGTYWHLKTRHEEWCAIENKEIKDSASAFDLLLTSAKYQTLVHGDAKIANFLLSSDQAAAVDFQYIGGGPGIKDIIYFLSSIYSERELFKNAQSALTHYFQILNLPEVEKEWRFLYPIAWADFSRFLLGWSPGHSKLNTYAEAMMEEALSVVKSRSLT